jgi:hypothetical protein
MCSIIRPWNQARPSQEYPPGSDKGVWSTRFNGKQVRKGFIPGIRAAYGGWQDGAGGSKLELQSGGHARA